VIPPIRYPIGGIPSDEENDMTCGHCEMSVREEVAQVPGVEYIDVNAQTGKLVVTASQPVADAAVGEDGYTAVRVA
jgi:copper chaperone CopZ